MKLKGNVTNHCQTSISLYVSVMWDLEKLCELIDGVMKDYAMVQDTLAEVRTNNDMRAKKNGELRDRLENMKGEVQGAVNDLIAQMMGINPEDVLSEEEINNHLKEAFQKFDEDNSGELGSWEFQQAWFFLGLKGSESEIKDAFKDVDTNKSGLIDINEFMTVIKGSRMAELSLGKVLSKMGVQLNNLDNQYENFRATMQRRRLMKKQYEENFAKMADMMINKLCGLVKKDPPDKDPEQEKLYNTLKDTFNVFDKDGSLQLGFEEYVEAWKFLGRGGNETEIKEVWDSVDVDGSGLIEWSEFAFSVMGEIALNFGYFLSYFEARWQHTSKTSST